MRDGPQAVVRMLGKRLAPLLLLLALIALVGDPRGGGVQGGLLAAAGVAFYLVVFGADRATYAFPPAVLRTVAVWGVALAFGAGVFAAVGRVFGFIVVDIARTPTSIGAMPWAETRMPPVMARSISAMRVESLADALRDGGGIDRLGQMRRADGHIVTRASRQVGDGQRHLGLCPR